MIVISYEKEDCKSAQNGRFAVVLSKEMQEKRKPMKQPMKEKIIRGIQIAIALLLAVVMLASVIITNVSATEAGQAGNENSLSIVGFS